VHMEIGYALLIAFFYIYFVVIQYDPVLSTWNERRSSSSTIVNETLHNQSICVPKRSILWCEKWHTVSQWMKRKFFARNNEKKISKRISWRDKVIACFASVKWTYFV
jgi:hypothetical protein